MTAARHPERVTGLVLIAPGIPFTPHPVITTERFTAEPQQPEGWDKFNARHWLRDWPDFLEFFFSRVYPEPHSTKQVEDGVRYGLDTTPEVIVDTMRSRLDRSVDLDALVASIRCPVLVLHAPDDEVNPYPWGARVAELTGGTLVTLEGSGHAANTRHPVAVNQLIHDFAARITGRHPAARQWTRPTARRRRALYLSSPIGLGHARRDMAIAAQLRERVPDLAVDWLSQAPVTAVLESAGERVHPASRFLANESAHLVSESGEHDLHCFQAFREMDEIMVANFHLFQEAVEDGGYDLVIADEAWDVDHFWHEHPHLKRAALAWLTDFVGFLPMPDGGAREARLTADYNAEMLEHVARHRWVRDRAIFVGNPEDILPADFGPGLPGIRQWTEEHFAFSGYITGFDPAAVADTESIRAELGYRAEERVCVVAVGGSGVGTHLLRKVIDAYPSAARRVPGLRMVVVAGPCIDPATLPHPDGVDVRAYVPDLHRHLAVCDLALVQGGLTTTMELTAARRPFLYFPLKHHFEQQFHVRYRLDQYGAGRPVDYDAASVETLGEAIATEVGRPVSYRDVETDGAGRAADLIAELL